MRIIRSGIEIELSATEMRNVFRHVKRSYLREDVESRAEEMGIDISNCVEKIMDGAEKSIDRNDSYWEAYWMSIEYAINEYFEET